MSALNQASLRRGARAAAGLVLLLAALSAGPALTRGKAVKATPLPSLCHAGETPLFQCATSRKAGAKQVAVCASDTGGAVQYRYGASGHVEMAFPATPDASSLKWASTGYSGGGEFQIHFKNAGVTYVVYSRMTRTNFKAGEPNNPVDDLGVTAFTGEHLISNRACFGTPIAGGHNDWIDEQHTRRLLGEGEFQDTPG